jgi:hypothetical protein
MKMGTGMKGESPSRCSRRARDVHPGNGEDDPGARPRLSLRRADRPRLAPKTPQALRFLQEVAELRRRPAREPEPDHGREGARADLTARSTSAAKMSRPSPAGGHAPSHRDQLHRAERRHHAGRRRAQNPGGSPADRAAGAKRGPMGRTTSGRSRPGAESLSALSSWSRLPHPSPARSRRRSRAAKRSASWRARRGGLPRRRAPLAVPRLRHRVRAAPRIHHRRRHAPPRLEGARPHRPLLHQAVRAGHELRRADRPRRQRVDELRLGQDHQAPVRQGAGGLPRLPRPAAARRGGPARLRHGDARHHDAHRQHREDPSSCRCSIRTN